MPEASRGRNRSQLSHNEEMNIYGSKLGDSKL
jgi:hypothetical protein